MTTVRWLESDAVPESKVPNVEAQTESNDVHMPADREAHNSTNSIDCSSFELKKKTTQGALGSSEVARVEIDALSVDDDDDRPPPDWTKSAAEWEWEQVLDAYLFTYNAFKS